MQKGFQIVIWAALFGAGALGGTWLAKSNFGAYRRPQIPGKSQSAAPSSTSSASRPSGFVSDEEMMAAIMAAAAEREPLLRAHLLIDSIGRLSTEELAHLFTAALRIGDRGRRETLLRAILGRWFTLDPTGAQAACRPFLEKWRAAPAGLLGSQEETVHSAWAAVRPSDALAEAFARPYSLYAESAAFEALGLIGKGDPSIQLQALQAMPPGKLRTELCEKTIKALATTDIDAAMAALSLLPGQKDRLEARSEILGELAKHDPSAAINQLLAAVPDLSQGIPAIQLINTVLKEAASHDPEAVLGAINQLPPELQHRATAAALMGWAGQDPVAALNWAVENGLDVTDIKFPANYNGGSAWQTLISTAAQADRSKVIAWLTAQPASPQLEKLMEPLIFMSSLADANLLLPHLSPQAQAQAMTNYVPTLFADNKDNAVAWVSSQPAGPVRSAAIKALIQQQAQRELDTIPTLLGNWPPGPDQDAALSGVVQTLYRSPPRQMEYARQISDPEGRESAFESIYYTWRIFDTAAARAWLASTSDIPPSTREAMLRSSGP